MLESFRKKDSKSAPTARVVSPYSEMQEALTPSKTPEPVREKEEPAVQATRAEAPKVEAPKVEAPKTDTSAAGNVVSKLIVGPDIKLRGAEITDCDTLVVEGRVEAAMDSRVIQIAENGVFVGKVCIDVAEIRGCFEGELTARKQLVIHSTGHVNGKIRYGKITVEEGGELLGDVASLGNTKTTSGVSPVAKSEAANSGAGVIYKAASR